MQYNKLKAIANRLGGTSISEPHLLMPLRPVLVVLGLVAASVYLPFGMIFSQAGRPLLQTLFSAAVLGANVLFNTLLIPMGGINGAALGTALSYLAAALLLVVLMRKLFKIRIWL